MARLNQFTSLIAVKEKDKIHIKILYSKDGQVKRFKTNVYIKDAGLFKKDKIFKKNNAVNPSTYKDDQNKLDETQLKLESVIESFEREYNDKPTIAQLDALIKNYKDNSKKNYTYISDFWEEYLKNFHKRGRNGKSVINAFISGFNQFSEYTNKKYTFNDINEEFFEELVNYFLFKKPKSNKQVIREPLHKLTEPVCFDPDFGMNNNTLMKRLDACMSFIKWAVTKKDIKVDYDKIKEMLKKVKSECQIDEYSNIEFAFKKRADIKLLGSPEFENIIKDDSYMESPDGQKRIRAISKEVLIRAKDYFLISILTANRVSDLRAIKKHHIVLGKQKAKKTKEEFLLNSNQTIIDLLEKYNYDIKMNDAKYNKCIKLFLKQFYKDFLKKEELVWVVERRGKYEQYKQVEFFTLAGSHSGRRSFASILYNEGRYPKRKIMQFTGHHSEQEFDKYIQLSPEEDIQEISDFMNINYV